MRYFIFLILIVLFSFSANAERVKLEVAKKAATNAYILKASLVKNVDNVELSHVYTYNINTEPMFYVFDVNGEQGFVIISANNIASPIIGYSFEGSFPTEHHIPSFAYWLDHYAKQIEYGIINNVLPTEKAQNEWHNLLSNNPEKEKDVLMGQPLLLTTWNQDSPYNSWCPLDAQGPGGRVFVGCVATSMAQVMKFYNYPETGTGSRTSYSWANGGYGNHTVNFANQTYIWDNMPNRLSGPNDEVGKLGYHCGIAVNMNWGPNGSGSQTTNIVSALKNFYKYHSDCSHVLKSSYSDANWMNLLRGQVDLKRPMVYRGYDGSGGHAWNCDGYIGNEFHMNWGWGGSGNGYFSLNSLVSGGYDFTSGQGAVIDIYPASNYPENCSSTAKMITGNEGTFNDGSGNQNYANNLDCLYLLEPECGMSIQINFDYMSLASGDTVFVYEGNNTNAPLIQTFTQSNPASTSNIMLTEGGAFLIRFKTDGANTAEGWYASYKTTFCSGIRTIDSPSGILTDGSGICEYKNNTLCTWEIEPEGVNTFMFEFTSFDMANDNYDYVMVYKNVLNTANLFKGFTFNEQPSGTYTVEATKLIVRFRSNTANVANGWVMEYSSTVNANFKADNVNKAFIYPNPSNSTATLHIELQKSTNAEIIVQNIVGQTIANNTFSLNNGVNEINLNKISPELSQGIYTITLLIDGEKTIIKYVKN